MFCFFFSHEMDGLYQGWIIHDYTYIDDTTHWYGAIKGSTCHMHKSWKIPAEFSLLLKSPGPGGCHFQLGATYLGEVFGALEAGKNPTNHHHHHHHHRCSKTPRRSSIKHYLPWICFAATCILPRFHLQNQTVGVCSSSPPWSCIYNTRWWFQIFFYVHPIWGRFPFWRIFFRWFETTN